MMYWLLRVAQIPMLPIGFCVVCVAAGLIGRKRWPVVLGAAVLLLSSLDVTADAILRTLEDRYPPVSVEQCPAADAVLVLGGVTRVGAGPSSAVEWGEAVDRFTRGLDLWRAGKAPALILTAARIPGRGGASEGELLRQEAIRLGIPSGSIFLTEQVFDTRSEALAVRRLMDRSDWKRIILVTSAFHMRRSMMLMQRAGVDAAPFPVDYQTKRGERLITDYLPKADALMKSERGMREWEGLLYYTWLKK
jgi:uncharacterized SAM-binding protein YcdF (DUF218 family)